MRSTTSWVVAALSVAVMATASASPSFVRTKPEVTDLGASPAVTGNAPMTVTVALNLRDPDQAAALLQSTYTPGSPTYRQFLTPQQFYAQFGPTQATIAQVTQHFAANGLHVTQVTGTHLSVTGSAAAMQAEFGVELHTFAASATATTPAYRFNAPLSAPKIDAAIADAVETVVGLDTRPRFRPHVSRSIALAGRRESGTGSTASSSSGSTTNPFGYLTVADFASYYGVDPLYREGINGRGTTLGIVTLASYTASDPFAYWSAVGLQVASNRVTVVKVDGGSGPPSDASGSIETTLDIEQSGGISPAAKIEVYEAPNTSQGFVDGFAKAIDSNRADTLSCSWGEWEFFDTIAQGSGVTDPTDGRYVGAIKAYNDLFLQAALQGQSLYIASGDAGAYDETDNFVIPSWPPPANSIALSVDDPGTQIYTTATGGTTLPGKQTYAISATQNLTIDVKTEQAWGWDYLNPLCDALGLNPLTCGTYPAGSGGGVSTMLPIPFYQIGIPGIQRTVPHQTLYDYSQTPPAFVVSLPAGYAGRNVPDVAVNTDPETGYVIYYTSSESGFTLETFYGGTSFAAPQFNGVTSLYNQSLGHRVGLLNIALYNLVRFGEAYGGRAAPLRDIAAGDNWYWYAHQGYDQTTGVGVPDFTNLLKTLR